MAGRSNWRLVKLRTSQQATRYNARMVRQAHHERAHRTGGADVSLSKEMSEYNDNKASFDELFL